MIQSIVQGEIILQKASRSRKKVQHKKLRKFVEKQILRWATTQKDFRWEAPSRYKVLFAGEDNDSTTFCQVEIELPGVKKWKSSQTRRGIQQAFLECMRSLWSADPEKSPEENLKKSKMRAAKRNANLPVLKRPQPAAPSFAPA